MKKSVLGAPTVMIAIAACAPASPASLEGPATTATAEETAATTTPPPVETAAVVEASATAQPDTRVRDACAKLCERVATSCPAGRGDACLAQCAHHEAKSTGCEAEAEAAFLCQHQAKAAFCDNVVSTSCHDAFGALQRCQKGERVAVTTGPKAPDGWERVKDDVWGVTFLAPPHAALDPQAKSRTWRATHDGATYEVVELARPKKLDQQAMVKLVVAHAGVSCQKEMRLTGRVDKETVTFSRYETSCNQGDRRYGKLWIDEQRALSLLVKGEAKTELRDAFLDGIE